VIAENYVIVTVDYDQLENLSDLQQYFS